MTHFSHTKRTICALNAISLLPCRGSTKKHLIAVLRALKKVSEMSDTGVYGAATWKELSATGRLSEYTRAAAPSLCHTLQVKGCQIVA